MLRVARVAAGDGPAALVTAGDRWQWLPEVDGELRGWEDVVDAGVAEVTARVEELSAHRPGLGWDDVRARHQVLEPVGGGGKVVGVGLNYRQHAEEEFGAAVPETPLLFAKWRTSLCGPYDPIALPTRATAEVDYEVELAVVVGRRARDVPPEEAGRIVAGFTVANDLTARDVQRAEAQWTRAKSFDGFCPLGPWLTLTSLEAVADVEITSSVNGEVRQDSRTSLMHHSVGDILARLSEGTTLEPGDVVLTGTPAGVAMGRDEASPWLRKGDVVECVVGPLGALRNEIV